MSIEKKEKKILFILFKTSFQMNFAINHKRYKKKVAFVKNMSKHAIQHF